ncbi:MAG: Sir2 family NAD-dependent protein deacetylase [bacterium]|jgi:NAD-dependent deacetylase|nr:Sir2 family NAD-dependent protein deacetylase [bacterium]
MKESVLAEARARLSVAKRLVVLVGAGLSQESGVPVFRGAQGLWKSFRPEDLATPTAFARMPEEVWAWYRWRLEQLAPARPHAGHQALARLALTRSVTVVNQNVDGLLEEAFFEAGADLDCIMAVHGSIRRAHCQRCGASQAMAALPPDPVPTCSCGGRLRPSVVWFGESLDPAHLLRMDGTAHAADLALGVGSSALVWPAAGVLATARRRACPVIIVNPDPAAAVDGDLWLEGSAAAWLPRLLEAP